MFKRYLRTMNNFRCKTRASRHEYGNFFSVWLLISALCSGILYTMFKFIFTPEFDFTTKLFVPGYEFKITPIVFVFFGLCVIYGLFQVCSAVAFGFLSVRRLHDLNLSGILYWLYLFVYVIFMLNKNVSSALFEMMFFCILAGPAVMIFANGNPCSNNYGDVPEE